jgi:hypothetical protein
MKFVLTITFFLLLLHVGFAQHNTHRVIVQLKSTTDEHSTRKVEQLLANVGITSPGIVVRRMFPDAMPPPPELFRKYPFVPAFDLSRMYELKFLDTLGIYQTMLQLQNMPWVQYAELPLGAEPLTLPNDPLADSTLGVQKAVFKQIRAYAAWLQHQGDTATVVGVLDTGTRWDHEDMQDNIALNFADPINGIDDDGNGLIDDFRGWDFGGNDNNPAPDVANTAGGHGTSVASISSMTANNSIGGVGAGYKCRFLPIKIWNYNGNNFSNFRGYEAIVYAADMGCKVINCSWGANRMQLQYERDIINYATFQKDALIVAAGGNSFSEANFVPATTDHVLGVAFCDTLDRISPASTFSYSLGITAPGAGVFGIRAGGTTYGVTEAGSSMAAPLVSGAAALLRSAYPTLTAIQAAALLRANADVIDTLPANLNRRYRVGDGRLNMAAAVLKNRQHSIQVFNPRVRAMGGGDKVQSGDTIALWLQFLNALEPSTGVSARLSSPTTFVTVLDSNVALGNFAELETKVNASPFRFAVAANTPNRTWLVMRVDIQSNQGNYSRHFRIRVENGWVALDTNRINISIFANGRLGFDDLAYTNGRGTRYNNANMASDAGLMIGVSSTQVSNCVFSSNGRSDHFKPLQRATFTPFPGLDEHITSYYNDSLAANATIGIHVKQSSYALHADSLSKTVFLHYELTNQSNQVYDSAFVGLYHDWDIGNFNANKAAFDTATGVGYTYETSGAGRLAGVVLLSPNKGSFYAIDALPNNLNNNINLFDGFSIAEKWQTMSSGNVRTEAGNASANGNNVVQVYSARVDNWSAGERRKIGFALVMGDSLPELKQQAISAQRFYRSIHTAAIPAQDSTVFACEGDTLTIHVGMPGANQIKIYGDSLRSVLLFSGQSALSTLTSDTSFWISNCDSLFESALWKMSFKFVPKPSVMFTLSPDSLNFTQSQQVLITLPDTIQGAIAYSVNGQWQPQTSSSFSHTFDSPGIYQICVAYANAAQCADTLCTTYFVYLHTDQNTSVVKNAGIEVYPVPTKNELYIAGKHINQVTLFDLSGKVLGYELQMANDVVWQIRPQKIGYGVYYLKIDSPEGVVFRKVVLE